MTTRTWPRTVKATLLATVGAVVLSSCSIYDVRLPGGAAVGSNPITVHVKFRDVLDLVPQSTVKVDDVTVGRVAAVELDGYTADVTLTLPRDVDLPDNARAEIRQTSLLGEKFVSLSSPTDAKGKLGNGDVIPLSRSGRNPEVEEVLGALSLLLNGGGVGQLKTIAAELNNALDGRESEVKSVLSQLNSFVGQLNQNRQAIVEALDNLDRLARGLRAQDATIKQTLDDLPAAVRSINSQRADLVKTLKALQNLSGIGVRVIRASKAGTIDTLQSLVPVLNKLAEAGAALPKSLQVSLTYPFVDAAVGNSPAAARNLHMGDYVNLNLNLNLDLCDTLTKGTLVTLLRTLFRDQLPPELQVIVDQLPPSQFELLLDGLATTLLQNDAICGDDPVLEDLGGILTAALQALLSQPAGQALNAVINQLLAALGGLGSLPGAGSGSGSGSSGGLGGLLGGLTGGGKQSGSGSGGSGKSPGNSSGSGSGSGSGGGLLGDVLGLNRVGASYGTGAGAIPTSRPTRGDQLGALLLQGVGTR